MTSISDPGIVQVFDFGYHSDGSAFIVMEYLEGEPLDRRLARLGRLPVHETMRLARQLAISRAQYQAKITGLRAAVTAGDITQAQFDRYDAELVACLK